MTTRRLGRLWMTSAAVAALLLSTVSPLAAAPAEAATGAGGAVNVTYTSYNVDEGAYRLSTQPSKTLAPMTNSTATTINVDPSVSYQSYDGWGCAADGDRMRVWSLRLARFRPFAPPAASKAGGVGSFALQAWGDESIRVAQLDRPSYLLGAVIADPEACDGIRDQMRSLPRRGPKLHWREHDNDRARSASMRTITDLDAFHVVVMAAPVAPRSQERARAFCLERLAWQLDAHGVQLLTLEARPQELMRRDIRTVDALRSKGALPAGLRIDHGQPSVEPMLWIADQVLGALGEEMVTGRSEWFDTVRTSTTIHHVNT